MDRRTLLKTVLAAPVAAVVPAATGVAASPLPQVQVEIAFAPPQKLKPYADYVWEWFVSHDGETYYESFPTKEAAIEYAKKCDYWIVSECLAQDFDLHISGGWLIEHLNDNNYMEIGEGDGISATVEQERDLGEMVEQAIEAWAVKHKIDIRAWSFADTKNTVEVCTACSGSGYFDDDGSPPCAACGGRGLKD